MCLRFFLLIFLIEFILKYIQRDSVQNAIESLATAAAEAQKTKLSQKDKNFGISKIAYDIMKLNTEYKEGKILKEAYYEKLEQLNHLQIKFLKPPVNPINVSEDGNEMNNNNGY